MTRFKKHLIVAAVFALLWGIGTIMNSRPSVAQAAGGPTVTIDPTQLPLPVTGSITSTVKGTVGLASGTTVGLASGASVRVNNTVTDPVRIRNVNDAIQPFRAEGDCNGTATATGCGVNIFTVPIGKRAVIEAFSGSAEIEAGQVAEAQLSLAELGGLPKDIFFVPPTPPSFLTGGLVPGTSWGQQVRLYADPLTQIVGQASRGGSAPFSVRFFISGYLVDVPLTP
jgi:hypothetical protein